MGRDRSGWAALFVAGLFFGSALVLASPQVRLTVVIPVGAILFTLWLLLILPHDTTGELPILAAILLLVPAGVASIALAERVAQPSHVVLPLFLPVALLMTLGAALAPSAPVRQGRVTLAEELPRQEREQAQRIAHLGLLFYIVAPPLSLYFLLLDIPDWEGAFNLVYRFVLFSVVYGLGIGMLARAALASRRYALDFALAPLLFALLDGWLLKRLSGVELLLEWSLIYVAASLGGWLFFWLRPSLVALRESVAGEGTWGERATNVAAALGWIVVIVSVPALLGYGTIRLLTVEALQRGLLRPTALSLLPFLLVLGWTVFDVGRGYTGDSPPIELRFGQ